MGQNLIPVSTLIVFFVFFCLEVILAATKLNRSCEQLQFACGECETALQDEINDLLNDITDGGLSNTEGHWGSATSKPGARVKNGVTLEQTLERITEIMKKNNPQGDNKLNWMMIGKSGSLQQTTPGNPRIALKSPDGELWVTFNTDPNAAGYNAIEIMRWDGKTGTYKFQEISFPSKPSQSESVSLGHLGGHANSHVDLSGKRCIKCHREPMRPNWDTYRAWSGIIPPRDDLLEAVDSPLELGGRGQPDSNARIYLDFLQQIEAAKSQGSVSSQSRPRTQSVQETRARRLRVLDILRKGGKSASQKIKTIKEEIEQQGWSRVPHFPKTNRNNNFSNKTASLAGPAHLAFDQVMAQQMCQIATGLEEHPKFENFKYVLTGIMRCRASKRADISPEELAKYLPNSFEGVARDFYSSSDALNTPKGKIQIGESEGAVLRSVFEHTKATHEMSDTYKEDRHFDLLVEYNSNKTSYKRQRRYGQQSPIENIEYDAKYLTKNKFSDVGSPWTAITDPKGVKGVAESDPGTIASFRYILEPLGINTGAWSTSLGKDVTDVTYTFSDQFRDMLRRQPLFGEIMKSIPGENLSEKCKNLQKLSRSALAGIKKTRGQMNEFPDECRQEGLQLAQIELETPAKNLIQDTCMTCHGIVQASLPFELDSLEGIRKGLLAPSPSGRTWADYIKIALSEDHAVIGVDRMPPRGWKYEDFPSGQEKNRRDNVRRNILSAYVDFMTNDKRRPDERYTCEHLSDFMGRPRMKKINQPKLGEPVESIQ